jgi:hypothetical protein
MRKIYRKAIRVIAYLATSLVVYRFSRDLSQHNDANDLQISYCKGKKNSV